LLYIVISAFGFFVTAILVTRLNGLRTFSKMSSFDFVVTVAGGSIMATTVVAETPSLLEGALGYAALFACQRLVSELRFRTKLEDATDNAPRLLMIGERMIEEEMRQARVTRQDLIAKLREANVLHFGQVKAVVFEATGDISVLHGRADDELDPAMLEGVRDVG
jgi:uncharacterized membrane protein YcaP (DUF421 family)